MAAVAGVPRAAPQAEPLPQAVAISGAGHPGANGVYKALPQEYCGAPMYEHTERGQEYKITREPHHNAKTGATKHGWLLGRSQAPLYGAPTESLLLPALGWKKFGGEAPVPAVTVHGTVAEAFYVAADAARDAGDAFSERGDYEKACSSFSAGIGALKLSGERFGDAFGSRAAMLLSRRAGAYASICEHKNALRDAVAALQLLKGMTSADIVAREAAAALGCVTEEQERQFHEAMGAGGILDPGAPLVLRCVERWIGDLVATWGSGDRIGQLPKPKHMPADRYLEGMDDEAREAVLKKHLPEFFPVPGGTGIIQDETECLSIMRRWETVFASEDFQQRRRALWDVKGLSFGMRLVRTRTMVAEQVADILEPMGFAPGQPGLTRAVRQMQVYWSRNPACASKALDLEELADVSIADLQCEGE